MLESVIGSIAGPIFEKLWKAGGYAVESSREARHQVKNTEQVLEAAQAYHSKYLVRHGQVKIMPGLMKKPVPLDSIYTSVKFLNGQSDRYFATPDDLERLYRDSGRRKLEVGSGSRFEGMEIARDNQYLMVLGAPGIGKSTFLRKLGLEALKGTTFKKDRKDEGNQPLHRKLIPVFIELKTFRDSDIDLENFIAKEFEICGFPNSKSFTSSVLSQGKLLLLLDGLDEVPTRNLNRVIEHIDNFATQYNENTFISSCRIAAYSSSFRQLKDVTITDFDDGQIKQFIQRWFNSELDRETETAEGYWALLNKPENAGAKELSHTPLLLTFLCLVYDREKLLPHYRSTLYEKALTILLREWAAQKRLEQPPIYEGFHPELEKELLSEIAYSTFREDRLFFSQSDITSRITEFLSDTLGTPKYLNGTEILKTIEIQQGILVERAPKTYSFSHLTLQEYLTALYIVKNQLTQDLVDSHLTDERWREVFLLTIGLMGRRGHKLLEKIDQKAKEYISQSSVIFHLLKWAEDSTNIPTNKSSATHRSYQWQREDSPVLSSNSEQKGYWKRLVAITAAIILLKGNDSSKIIALTKELTNMVGVEMINTKAISNLYQTAEQIDANNYYIDMDGYSPANSSDIFISSKAVQDIEANIQSAKYLRNQKVFNMPTLQNLPSQLENLKEKVTSIYPSAMQLRGYSNELHSAWTKALGLDSKKFSSIKRDDWNILTTYLYAHQMLIRCKLSAVSISRTAWESLEEKIMRTISEKDAILKEGSN